MSAQRIDVTWLGHSTFQLITPARNVVIIDPWLMNNPACPKELKKPQRAQGKQLMLVSF